MVSPHKSPGDLSALEELAWEAARLKQAAQDAKALYQLADRVKELLEQVETLGDDALQAILAQPDFVNRVQELVTEHLKTLLGNDTGPEQPSALLNELRSSHQQAADALAELDAAIAKTEAARQSYGGDFDIRVSEVDARIAAINKQLDQAAIVTAQLAGASAAPDWLQPAQSLLDEHPEVLHLPVALAELQARSITPAGLEQLAGSLRQLLEQSALLDTYAGVADRVTQLRESADEIEQLLRPLSELEAARSLVHEAKEVQDVLSQQASWLLPLAQKTNGLETLADQLEDQTQLLARVSQLERRLAELETGTVAQSGRSSPASDPGPEVALLLLPAPAPSGEPEPDWQLRWRARRAAVTALAASITSRELKTAIAMLDGYWNALILGWARHQSQEPIAWSPWWLSDLDLHLFAPPSTALRDLKLPQDLNLALVELVELIADVQGRRRRELDTAFGIQRIEGEVGVSVPVAYVLEQDPLSVPELTSNPTLDNTLCRIIPGRGGYRLKRGSRVLRKTEAIFYRYSPT